MPSCGVKLRYGERKTFRDAKGAIQCRYRDHRDVSRADAPPQARRAASHRVGAQSSQTARRLPRGFLWPRGDRGSPRYS